MSKRKMPVLWIAALLVLPIGSVVSADEKHAAQASDAEAPEDTQDSIDLADLVEISHESEAVTAVGPDAELGRTQLLLSLPVTEQLRLRGGMRLDHRSESRVTANDTSAHPTLGFELRF